MELGLELVAIAKPLVIATLAAFIARRKGRNVAGWFVLGLLFQILALPVVVLLPSRKQPLDETAVGGGRVFALLGKVFAGAFLGFMAVFAVNGGSAGSSRMSSGAWVVLIIWLALFIPAVVFWARQAYKPDA